MPAAIQLSGVHKAFGANQVLKGVSLTVNAGEVVCVLGPSGSGKTTLLRCANFLERADAGRLRLEGVDVDLHGASKSEIHDVRLRVPFVFQNFNLFKNMTALGNVMEGLVTARKVPAGEARARAEAVMGKVGLADKLDSYPAQLFGGQQQRVAIARALVLEPEAILFDEPTSALDPELIGEVLAVMKLAARDGVTMVVVTHEVGFAAEVANHVVFMDGGVVVEEGPPEAVIAHPETARARQFLRRLRPDADNFSI